MPFGLLFTGDEEVGGVNGAKLAAERIRPDFFIAIDGGRPDLIVTKEKGILLLQLTATGKAAHAARPWLGRSGFDLLVEDYLEMQQLFTEETNEHWHKTMVLTKCRAGNGSTNIVPEKATAILDIRYTENDDPDLLVRSIKDLVAGEIQVLAKEPVFVSAPSAYLDLLVTHSGGARVGFEHGASDARYLSQLGIPGAIWGADGEMTAHMADERIVLSSMFTLYDRIFSYFAAFREQGGCR
jgi:succinyl-diaminopimelate desuccinylase